ncbi:hypothetical protein [Actinophytocola sp. NPDC049390]|uniref:hypothetical protein n=1 Tax=Actinophytocola sp. NPDC049390 TaxID=3363894 RepID=UPI00378AE10D
MGDEVNELAALFAAWRDDIDSVPMPTMPLLEAALLLHADSPIPPAAAGGDGLGLTVDRYELLIHGAPSS